MTQHYPSPMLYQLVSHSGFFTFRRQIQQGAPEYFLTQWTIEVINFHLTKFKSIAKIRASSCGSLMLTKLVLYLA